MAKELSKSSIYAQKLSGSPMPRDSDPHNQFLLQVPAMNSQPGSESRDSGLEALGPFSLDPV